MSTWKEVLADRMSAELADEIDVFELQLELRRQGKIDEKVFAETRLRRGTYGQRYDNGQRHDGLQRRELAYPCGELTKGPDTVWDAPGMQRIKIPFGGLNQEQMNTLADLAEEYSDGICHITTRQDVQLHYVHIDDTPDLMRRLAAAGITTREACGNSVRNVTGCPFAGVCHDEAFDVTPYAKACAWYLIGHPDTQDFGRKFKISFSGCSQHACALAFIHDVGIIATKKLVDGEEHRGFILYVGGGLGAVPHQAQLFDTFVPEAELLPTVQAIGRVFARLGEKRNRARARLKFVVANLGIEEFRRIVLEERAVLTADERWTAYLPAAQDYAETPLKPSSPLNGAPLPDGFAHWRETNVYPQKQPGYAVATVTLPLGDITSHQMRRLADIARRYIGDNVRTTVEQNIVLRWVAEADLPGLYTELAALGLGQSGASTIVDVTACPGTDTCKLGIASSRGLAVELRQRLAAQSVQLDAAVQGLRIKISGCFNSCGQHHIADIGFYGNSRTIGGYKVPHFQVVLGGKWTDNAGAYGLAIGAVPSKRIPEVVTRITDRYVREREGGESFQEFISRIGKKALRDMLEDLMRVPAYSEDPSFYSDWGDPREFTVGDIAVGECAGEVISLTDFDLAAAERQVFEAQLHLDDGNYELADRTAYHSMIQAAKALVRTEIHNIPDSPDFIVDEFRTRFHDTGLFRGRTAGEHMASYLFRRHEDTDRGCTSDGTHRLIEEAQLFIEAAHACNDALKEKSSADRRRTVESAGFSSPS